jgi:hypothetical protein
MGGLTVKQIIQLSSPVPFCALWVPVSVGVEVTGTDEAEGAIDVSPEIAEEVAADISAAVLAEFSADISAEDINV